MQHYGLIGEKLGHSLSRPIHEAIFAHAGIQADYRIIEIPRERFAREAAQLMHTLDGFNVTIPYKQDVMPLLAAIDPLAREIGAVNTIVTGSAPCGYNTDAAGFMRMLQHHGMDPAAAPHCYILGSGGTSKTVRACLKAMGARGVTVVSRHPQAGTDVPEISYQAFYDQFPHTGGFIVNASAAGMWPRTDVDNICAIHPERIDGIMRHACAVADVVYNPSQTFLTKAAARAGLPWCTGLYMLVEQAVEAQRIWQGGRIPSGLTEKIMSEVHL